MPDISVIVPVYNAAGDLPRCVDSVLRQAEVVDIGLTDGRVSSVTTRTGAVYGCRAVIVATGTAVSFK